MIRFYILYSKWFYLKSVKRFICIAFVSIFFHPVYELSLRVIAENLSSLSFNKTLELPLFPNKFDAVQADPYIA